jgi:biotin carboxyl carrier protein
MLNQKQKDLYLKFIIANTIIALNDIKFISVNNTNNDDEITLNILSNIDNYHHVNVIKLNYDNKIYHILSINDKKIDKRYKIINFESNLLHFAQIDLKERSQKDFYFKLYPDDISFVLENSGYHLKMKTYPDSYGIFYDKIKENKKSDDLNEKFVLSPLPGLVIGLNVQEGETVAVNTNLLVIEAMKMQNVIYSTKAGKIKKIFVKERDIVQSDQKLIEFE